jgi:hypothetical protein
VTDNDDDLHEFFDPASDQLHALAHCLDALTESSMGVEPRMLIDTKEDVMRAMARISGQLGQE